MTDVLQDEEGNSYSKGRKLAAADTAEGGEPKEAVVTCEDIWSQLQMECIQMQCDGDELLTDAIRRVRRTAGNYAQIYLDDEGTPNAGRFAWCAMAAFAAKQVVAGVEYANDKIDSWSPLVVRQAANVTFYYLLKGNLWLFFETVPWHLHWKKYGSQAFFHCVDRRNVDTYDTPAKELTKKLPWALGENSSLKKAIEERVYLIDLQGELPWEEVIITDSTGALAEANNCQVTSALKKAFELIDKYESAEIKEEQQNYAIQGAEKLLVHEQKLRLQAWMYEHEEFRTALWGNSMGRWAWHLFGAKDPEVIFNAEPRITPEIERELEAIGLRPQDVTETMSSEEGELYDIDDRWKYIQDLLKQFRWLMYDGFHYKGEFRDYMIRQLEDIANWQAV